MIGNWLEWSEAKHTLHENRPGKADETFLGEVRYIRQEDPHSAAWEATKKDGTKVGTFPTRDAAKRALMDALDVQSLEGERGRYR